jgi:hypothetical protein
MPRASIIIVNYNSCAYLQPCLESVLQASGDDEVILVDNHLADGSASLVQEHFPMVRLLQSPTNLGFAGGCNYGAAYATGDYLAFLNPDTVVEPEWLDALLDALVGDASIGLATSQILLLHDRQRINTAGNDVHYTGLTLCRDMGKRRHQHVEPQEVGAISGAAFVMRSDVFAHLGGFDEGFFTYMEDTDLSWRARLAGYRSVYVPASIVYHDYTLRFGPRKTFYQERNRYLMLLKNMQWQTLLRLLPALLLAEGVTWGFTLLREPRRLGNKIAAYGWIIRHWALVLEQRRRTQALRRVSDQAVLAAYTSRIEFAQTGTGFVARTASALFDPLFLLLRRSGISDRYV